MLSKLFDALSVSPKGDSMTSLVFTSPDLLGLIFDYLDQQSATRVGRVTKDCQAVYRTRSHLPSLSIGHRSELRKITQHASKLKEVAIRNIPNVEWYVTHLPAVCKLDFCQFGKLPFLIPTPTLRRLDLTMGTVPVLDYRLLPHLEELRVDCQSVSPLNLRGIASGCPQLRILLVYQHQNFFGTIPEEVLSLKKLEKLAINGMLETTLTEATLPELTLLNLIKPPNLQLTTRMGLRDVDPEEPLAVRVSQFFVNLTHTTILEDLDYLRDAEYVPMDLT